MNQLIQVEFKGSRRELFAHAESLSVRPRDVVVVPVEHGEDIGTVTRAITPEIADKFPSRARSILRVATADDKLRLRDLRERELNYRREVIQLVRRHGLTMKIVDVEIQFDYTKVTVYFTADHRVDFRNLVRDLAAKYRTRIELRQIGVRDEARRVDGYGVCGQRQCCSGHLKEFAPITTAHAREQDLSLNPQKISGNCGRLLCCLRYEVEMYAGVRKLFPAIGSRVTTAQGSGTIDRIDYFKEEAVIVTDDFTQIRAGADAILSVESAGRGRRRGRGASPEAVSSGQAAGGGRPDIAAEQQPEPAVEPGEDDVTDTAGEFDPELADSSADKAETNTAEIDPYADEVSFDESAEDGDDVPNESSEPTDDRDEDEAPRE